MNAVLTADSLVPKCFQSQISKTSSFISKMAKSTGVSGGEWNGKPKPRSFSVKIDAASSDRCPDFIIIGAAKCATTSVYMHLRRHPELNMSKPKETNFFSWDDHYQKGWKWYSQCFDNENNNGKMIGEVSPTYSDRITYPETAARIVSALPRVKIVYIVRNPLERTASHWRMLTRDSAYTPSFKKALKEKEYHPFLQDRSKYWFQISAYRRFIPDDRIKVVFFEDFKKAPKETLNDLMDFIGVSHFKTLNNRVLNHGKKRCKGRSEKKTLQVVRQLPIVEVAKSIVPEPVKEAVWKLPVFTRKQETTTPWTNRLRENLIEELIDDTRLFLDFYGKPRSYWGF